MSKLDDILTNTSSTLFCMGQDWKPGDGSASKVDDIDAKAKAEIKDLFLELIDECTVKGGEAAVNGEILRKKVLEL